ncbi:MAG: tryptophan synthase subunit alpha [Acidobacteria bacterium]|nr:tryptophan synthase subunit alpha [Acidobacteriota bacterium]MBV9480556.1 tryptophan synthase subunit alpha [Acidobacteriota bacterium]
MAIAFQTRPALVAYVTCGDPDLTTTRNVILAAFDAGAEIIELGVPFSDPVADGRVIQRASDRALGRGTTLKKVLELAADIRRRSQAGLIIFSYLNPILQMGFRRFAQAAAQAGVDGALVTDLPVEEADDYLHEMRMRRLSTIFLAAPTSTDQRLEKIAQSANGFVYAVSRTGVTGAQERLLDDARQLVIRLRRFSRLPIAVGFGISTPAQFVGVGEFAEAAVVGSAIVETIEQNPGREPEAVREFINRLFLARPPSSAKMV